MTTEEAIEILRDHAIGYICEETQPCPAFEAVRVIREALGMTPDPQESV